MSETYPCPVCGFQMDYPAKDYHICPCCGNEFGYNDFSRSHAELRKDWIEAGMPWFSDSNNQPEGWNPTEQLKKEFGGAGQFAGGQ